MSRKKKWDRFLWWLLPCGQCGSTFFESCHDSVEPYLPKHAVHLVGSK